ncbi:hypothetical protein RMQ50_004476 [Vibrio alginolyticus]|nr:hypothetical protein [Vibrio alginolyticus]
MTHGFRRFGLFFIR